MPPLRSLAHLSDRPATPPGLSAHPAVREKALLEQIRDRITEGDIDACMEALRGALKADVSMRAPRPLTEAGKRTANNYQIVADWPVRLAAVKMLLSYRFGLPGSVIDMQVALPAGNDDDRKAPSREEMIDQLRASGANLAEIASTWLEGVRRVDEEAPLPKDLRKTKEVAEQLSVVDV